MPSNTKSTSNNSSSLEQKNYELEIYKYKILLHNTYDELKENFLKCVFLIKSFYKDEGIELITLTDFAVEIYSYFFDRNEKERLRFHYPANIENTFTVDRKKLRTCTNSLCFYGKLNTVADLSSMKMLNPCCSLDEKVKNVSKLFSELFITGHKEMIIGVIDHFLDLKKENAMKYLITMMMFHGKNWNETHLKEFINEVKSSNQGADILAYPSYKLLHMQVRRMCPPPSDQSIKQLEDNYERKKGINQKWMMPKNSNNASIALLYFFVKKIFHGNDFFEASRTSDLLLCKNHSEKKRKSQLKTS